ncbi:MAG: nucleoside recognition domain-containing protein [Ignavibacteriota bacterium]
MLNWIWLGLIIIAIAVATGRDISEISSDRFRNGAAIPLTLVSDTPTSADHYTADVIILKRNVQSFYEALDVASLRSDTLHLSIDHATNSTSSFVLPSDAIKVWQDMAAAQGDDKRIVGKTAIRDGNLLFTPEPVKFRILAKVANEGLLKTADVAVTIVLGLIGIMALWLGIMKIAEAAGLITLLAKLAKPVMVRLFPDVPPEHPAMGAMLSNMAANFLGLSNAATPLGLKAMEELNKLNPNAGTATNAMCMFLTINTSAITLIPATVIAIRVSLGSKNPTDIIIPTFIATVIALTCGIIFNRAIQRFFPIKEGNA